MFGQVQRAFQVQTPGNYIKFTFVASQPPSHPQQSVAVESWVRCTALARIVHGDTHWMLGLTHTQLAQQYLHEGTIATTEMCHGDSL